mgnify:CR=1 FL=1
MLELKSVNAGYGAARILRDVSFHAEAGEIVCLLGRNGAGKTTTMQAIMGLLPLSEGSVALALQSGVVSASAAPGTKKAANALAAIDSEVVLRNVDLVMSVTRGLCSAGLPTEREASIRDSRLRVVRARASARIASATTP